MWSFSVESNNNHYGTFNDADLNSQDNRQENPQQPGRLKNYLNQIPSEFITGKIIPFAWLGLFAHDIAQFYLQPEKRYGNTFADIFLGPLSQPKKFLDGKVIANHNMWLFNLGTQLPNAVSYYFPTFAFISVPIIAAIAESVRRDHWRGHSEYVFDEANFNNDFVRWLLPYSKYPTQLSRMEYALRHDIQNDSYFNQIVNLANDHAWLAQLHAIRTLAHIAKDNGSYSERAINALRNVINNTISMNKLYAKNHLWMVKHPVIDQLFELPKGYILFYLLQVALHKAIGLANYYQQKNECEKAGKVFTFMEHLADFACSVCGDKEYVYPPNSFESQSCLDDLFNQEQTASEILNMLDRALLDQDFNEINLSKQGWNSWSNAEWQQFLVKVSQTKYGYLENLDLSSPVPQLWARNDKIIALNNDFKISIKKLRLENQKIGQNIRYFFQNGILSNATEQLDLSSIQLGSDAKYIANALENFNIKSLKLSQNSIADLEFQNLAVILKLTPVENLDISYNLYSRAYSGALFQYINATNIRSLSLAGNDNDLPTLAVYYPDKMFELNISGSAIEFDDASMLYSIIQNTEKLNIANTYLTDDHIDIFDDFFTNATTKYLNIGYNQLTNDGLDTLGNIILKLPLNELTLDGHKEFSADQLEEFGRVVAQSSIENLSMADCGLSDSQILSLAKGLRNAQSNHLKLLNLSNNLIHYSEASAECLEILSKLGIEVRLSGNALRDDGAMYFTNMISNKTNLYLSGNQISSRAMPAINAKLPMLNSVYLDNNAIDDQQILDFAKSLIAMNPAIPFDILSIAGDDFTLDDMRAVASSNPAISLCSFNFSHTGMSENSKRSLLRILPRTNIHYAKFSDGSEIVERRPIGASQGQMFFAPRSALNATEYETTSSNVSNAALVGGYASLLLGFALLMLLYRTAKNLTSPFAQCTSRLFNRDNTHTQETQQDFENHLQQTK